MVGELIVPTLFSDAYLSMKKGPIGPNFLDFSEFIMNFQKIKKKIGFTVIFGFSEGKGIINPPPKLHPKKHY